MQSQWQTTSFEQSVDLAATRHKVLRNTYSLLAISMIPTALGAYAGVALNFRITGLVGLLLSMAVIFGGQYAIHKTKEKAAGVFVLLGWTAFMGLWLSQMLQGVLHLRNGGELIALAAGGTATIFMSLAAFATITKKDFSFLANFLFIGLILLLIASLANIFFAIPAVALTISAVSVLLFSAYILHDVSQIVHGGETNYVWATMQLYLDVLNIFVSLLNLLSFFGGDRD